MATVAPTISLVGEHTAIFTWAGITSANADGAPIGKRFADYSDRSVQVLGTFGAGTLHFEGSNDGTNYNPITDPQGNAFSKTAVGHEQVTEINKLQRPRVTAADGATNLTVVAVCKRQRGGVEV